MVWYLVKYRYNFMFTLPRKWRSIKSKVAGVISRIYISETQFY